MNKCSFLKPLLVLAVILIPLIIFPIIFPQYGKALALFFSIVVLWFTELIPLPVTGLLVPVLSIFYGLLDSKLAFSSFGNQVIFLFLGSFILAEAMRKHAWDKRMAYFLLSTKYCSKSANNLICMVALICWALSMWISNTATCAMMAPLCIGLSRSLSNSLSNAKEFNDFNHKLLLTCAFSSSIGGMATPVGSPPNLLAIEFLKDKNIQINFVEWIFMGLPISLTMLFILLLIMQIKFPIKELKTFDKKNYFRKQLAGLGAIKVAELQVAFCFFLAVILWVTPSILEMIFSDIRFFQNLPNLLPIGAVATFVAILLFIMPIKKDDQLTTNLVWKDLEKIDWGTIILFAGGLSLGLMLNETGLASFLGQELFSNSESNFLIICITVILFSILLSEFSSNTASAAIIIPLILGSSMISENFQTLAIAAAFAASFGFMLPVSTPPNAIIYGTGKISLKHMIKTGIIFDLLGAIVIFVFSYFLFY